MYCCKISCCLTRDKLPYPVTAFKNTVVGDTRFKYKRFGKKINKPRKLTQTAKSPNVKKIGLMYKICV